MALLAGGSNCGRAVRWRWHRCPACSTANRPAAMHWCRIPPQRSNGLEHGGRHASSARSAGGRGRIGRPSLVAMAAADFQRAAAQWLLAPALARDILAPEALWRRRAAGALHASERFHRCGLLRCLHAALQHAFGARGFAAAAWSAAGVAGKLAALLLTWLLSANYAMPGRCEQACKRRTRWRRVMIVHRSGNSMRYLMSSRSRKSGASRSEFALGIFPCSAARAGATARRACRRAPG